jgi:chemotaxis protein methyltransferase CheR
MSFSPATFTYLAQMVRDHSAIVLDETKAYVVESRLGPLLYLEGVRDIDELAFRLRDDRFGPLHRKVLDAMTNNETWFFRDLYPFEALKSAILPQLLREREDERCLSVWSAACSSGQEIYSVAMLIRENFPSLLNWRLTLLGTDISQSILERARAGVYSQLEVNRGLPAILLAKYFQQAGREWRLKKNILEMAGFRSINLSSPPWPPLGQFDVAFLRNVLIYFSLDVRREILARIRQVLRPGGILFLGSAETTLNLDDSYERVPFQKSYYYRPKL